MNYLARDDDNNLLVLSTWDGGKKFRIQKLAFQIKLDREPSYRLRCPTTALPATERMIRVFQSRGWNGANFILTQTLSGHTAALTEKWHKLTTERRVIALFELLDHKLSAQQLDSSNGFETKLSRVQKTLQLATRSDYPAERDTALTIALDNLQVITQFQPKEDSRS